MSWRASEWDWSMAWASKALKEHPLLREPYICSFFRNEIPRPKVGHGRWTQKQRREHGTLRGLLCGERWRVNMLLAALASSRKINYVFCVPARWLSRGYFPARVCPSHGWVTWIMWRSSHQNIWTHSNGVYTLVFLWYYGSASARPLISDISYQGLF